MPKEEEKERTKYSIPKNKIESKEYKDYSKKTFGDFHEEFSGKICKIQVLKYPIKGIESGHRLLMAGPANLNCIP
jgi:hypothetical protein